MRSKALFSISRGARLLASLTFAALTLVPSAHAGSWWNKEWTVRKKITVDTSAHGANIASPVGAAVVLVRLHDGNLQFPLAREDGSDIRFVAEDDKTLLSFQLERFDGLLNEAFAWVRLPEVKPNGSTAFWLYYGNATPKPDGGSDGKKTYAGLATLAYHFGERNAPPTDATGNGGNAQNAGVNVEGALVGGGLRFAGTPPVIIPETALGALGGGSATLSLWIKPAPGQASAIILARRAGATALTLGIDAGKPYLEIIDAAGTQRTTPAGEPLASSWHHIAVVAEKAGSTLYLDGEAYGKLNTGLPAQTGPLALGGAPEETTATYQGDIDELVLLPTALNAGAIKLIATTQGTESAKGVIAFSEDEQTGGGGHSGYFGVIIHSLTFDGWVVIVVLGIMAVISWFVMVTKVRYLNALSRGNRAFMAEWQRLASDLTAPDHGDSEKVKSLGGRVQGKAQRSLHRSSVYRIYRIGSEEIRHRLALDHSKTLSSRSIQAIRAALDGGLVREKQRIDRSIVLLTICISGGPFLGLLGTVVGVMITFAAVAAAGDVNVNAIAPGIAAALLATVAGLAVAIPSLFGYNYILSRVKDVTADMHVFVDEFVTRMAEFYAGNGEKSPPAAPLAPLDAQKLHALLREILDSGKRPAAAFAYAESE